MLELFRRSAGGGVVRVVCTDRSDGDVHPRRVDAELLYRRQEAVTGRRWVMVDQVHGRDWVERRGVDGDPAPVIGVGDVLVGDGSEPIAIWAADCAPIVLLDDAGGLVGCHAGWRGLAAGVIDVAVDRSAQRPVAAVLGPCVHPCCYEFGRRELATVASGLRVDPDRITGLTASGAIALDVPSAVAIGLDAHGIELDAIGPCTGCDDRWFSHRRGDAERHALVAWNEEPR
jgi:polyphenol oxidase